jgi:hypothetical protein
MTMTNKNEIRPELLDELLANFKEPGDMLGAGSHRSASCTHGQANASPSNTHCGNRMF